MSNQLTTKLTSIADEVREINNSTDKLTLDEVSASLSDANTQISEIEAKITRLEAILDAKASN